MYLQEITFPIKGQLAEVEKVLHQKVTCSIPFVTDVAEYVIQNGGKRLRPILTLLSACLSGVQGESAIRCATAMEFFHTATLMHDDVIDNAEMRRGKSSTNSRWGNQVAVLVGDYFYCRASDLLVSTGDLKIIECVTRAMQATTEGEILEITKSNDLNTTEGDYLKVVMNKTAILMAAACEIGGLLGRVSEEFIVALRHYGQNLGIAFQLADDVLDYTSELNEFGKVEGTDLKEGKLTLPLIVALRHAGETDKKVIRNALIANRLERIQLKEVLSVIESFGGIQYTLDLAKNYLKRAQEALAPFKPSLEKEALISLTDYVVTRKS